jgi:hypothetical protein
MTARGKAAKRRSSFGVPPLGELTASAERRSLSLALEPAAAAHALTDLAEMGLKPLFSFAEYPVASGLRSRSATEAE